MEIVKGMVVKAIAGRDKGIYFVVTEISGDRKYVLISDGRTRKLSGPKKKSIKHLKMTGTVIDINDITNKKLKMVLKNIDCSVNESEV
ncbi:MAG: KOW domain-containing RNA-binding protein [Oscillospiraceae bacterium]|nr:KOW domain-containing RNA-binding protein [Oscillospiraceae bacterium]